MSGKRKSQRIEESSKKPKLDAEISDKVMDTRKIHDVIWQKIFGFFTLEEIKLNVALVCRHFYEISNDCVQKIYLAENFFASDHHYKMFDALSTFNFLRSIEISCDMEQKYAKVVDYFLMHSLKICPRLRFIDTSHKLSIGFLDYVYKYGQNLYGLDLCAPTSDLSPLKKGIKNLKHLGLFGFDRSNFKDADLLTLLENCEEVNSINLQDCEVTEDTMLKLVNLKWDKLKHLEFCQEIGNKWLQDLENCHKLESLAIEEMDISTSGFESISKLKNLKMLQFGYENYFCGREYKADDLIKMFSIGKFKKLKALYINDVVDTIGELLLSIVIACPNLQHLAIKCLTDNRKCFPKNIIKILLENFPKLMKFKLEWNRTNSYELNPTDNRIFVKSEIEESLGNFKNKFKVKISSRDDNLIKICREMWILNN